MKLSDLKPDEGDDYQDIAICGVDPISYLLELLDDRLDLDSPEWKGANAIIPWLVFELKDKTNELHKTLMRFHNSPQK